MNVLLVAMVAGALLTQPIPPHKGKEGEKEYAQDAVFCPIPDLVDSTTLGKALKAQGYEPGPDFKALVIEIEATKGCGITYEHFDYNGTAGERDTWWPASTVKIFAAVAALERLHAWGFTPAASVTFQYSKATKSTIPEGLTDVTLTVEELVRAAITPSDNTAYDRLVEIAGFEHLNEVFLSDDNGLGSTVLLRGYSGRHRYADSNRGSLRHSPPIDIVEGDKTLQLPETLSRKSYKCPNQGNCVPLRDLAEIMRRVMLHDELPKAERFKLGPKEVALLHSALAGKRARGNGVVDGLKESFGPGRIEVFHKPGFAKNWFSDNVFVRDTKRRRMWLVVMANRPGRDCLDEAAKALGIILRDHKLHAPPKKK